MPILLFRRNDRAWLGFGIVSGTLPSCRYGIWGSFKIMFDIRRTAADDAVVGWRNWEESKVPGPASEGARARGLLCGGHGRVAL
jgi:hypothetical protein